MISKRELFDSNTAEIHNRFVLMRQGLRYLEVLSEAIENYIPHLCADVKTPYNEDEIFAGIRGIEAVLALDSTVWSRFTSLHQALEDLAESFYALGGLLAEAAPKAEDIRRRGRRYEPAEVEAKAKHSRPTMRRG